MLNLTTALILAAFVAGYLLSRIFEKKALLSDKRKLAEKLRIVSEQSETLTNNLAAAVTIEESDGSISLCSPYIEVLTGYTVDEVLKRGADFFASIVIEEDKQRYERFRQMSEMGEAIPVRYRIRHKSGIVIWMETRLVPIINDEADISSLMGVSVDVTASVCYQDFIEEQNRDLSDFAFMVSHDLKAPIFTIKGMVSALEEDYSDVLAGVGKDQLRYINDATTRLERLVASIVEYSSLSKATPEELVDLAGVVSEVEKDMGEMLKQTNGKVVISSELPQVFGSRIRLYQLFSNLIGNALKYRDPQRIPVVELRKITNSEDHYFTLEIKDNGLGIPAEKLSDIFRPYHRACSSDIEGSGIGLACVKKIIERIGGSVSVQSKLGEGSSFFVKFPIVDREPRKIPSELRKAFELYDTAPPLANNS